MEHTVQSTKPPATERFFPTRRLSLLWALAGALLVASGLVYLNQTGILPLFWGRAPLTDIRPKLGFAYIAPTGHPEWSSYERPSLAQVLEDGKPLPGPANVLHEDIRQVGLGRYSFWYDYVYFSASDNSDPPTNGRQYEVRGPVSIPAPLTWLIYGMTVLMLGMAVFQTIRKNSPAVKRFPGALRKMLRRGFHVIPEAIHFLRTNRISAYVFPMLFWLILVLLGMEVLLRVTVYNQPLFFRQSNWFGSIPADGSFYLRGNEGYALTHYEGLTSEIATPYRDGMLDILLFGDSFTEGLQVPDGQKYASVAEMLLRQDGCEADIHNLGRSGTAMADYVSWLPGYRSLYQPGLIVVQLQPDDFIESFYVRQANYFVAEGTEIVGLVHRYDLSGEYVVGDALHWGYPTLMLMRFGSERLEQIEAQTGIADWLSVWNAFLQGKTRMERVDAQTITTANDSTFDEFDVDLARQQVDLLLDAAGDVPVIVILFPHAPKISGDQIIWNDLEQGTLVEFFSQYYPQITVVNPLPEFQALASEGVLPMGFFNSPTPGWGHLNHRGHVVMGELLAETIVEALK